MKAILCTRLGGADDLELADIPEPIPGFGEAVVTVKATALNFFDTLIIAGRYQIKPSLPFSPGAEFSGIVERVAADVTAVKPGDRVVGNMGFGAARERVVVRAERLVRLPDNLDFERAAGLTVIYGTGYYALKNCAGLKPGETLAVLGAAGGTGLAAVELGKTMGARVIACASSSDKLAFARQHGADEGVNYVEQDLKEALRAVSGGRGIDVVYDPVGGPLAEPALRAIAWDGRFLVVGFAAGEIPRMPLNLVLLKNCQLLGVHWGAWVERDPQGHRANMAELLHWCSEGRISAHVHAIYPLDRTADALKELAHRQVMGKVLIRP